MNARWATSHADKRPPVVQENSAGSCNPKPARVLLPGRRGVTLGKPDIKVETINKETHSLEEDSGSVSTASRMVKAMYSVSSSGTRVLSAHIVFTACGC